MRETGRSDTTYRRTEKHGENIANVGQHGATLCGRTRGLPRQRLLDQAIAKVPPEAIARSLSGRCAVHLAVRATIGPDRDCAVWRPGVAHGAVQVKEEVVVAGKR